MKKGVESLGRVRAQGIVLLLVMFVVGALAGVAFERVRQARPGDRGTASTLRAVTHAEIERGPGGLDSNSGLDRFLEGPQQRV